MARSGAEESPAPEGDQAVPDGGAQDTVPLLSFGIYRVAGFAFALSGCTLNQLELAQVLLG